MPATIKVDLNQIKGLIAQITNEEKEELSRYLDNLILRKRFKKFLSRKKNVPLSIKEITEEVEKVRAERYK